MTPRLLKNLDLRKKEDFGTAGLFAKNTAALLWAFKVDLNKMKGDDVIVSPEVSAKFIQALHDRNYTMAVASKGGAIEQVMPTSVQSKGGLHFAQTAANAIKKAGIDFSKELPSVIELSDDMVENFTTEMQNGGCRMGIEKLIPSQQA